MTVFVSSLNVFDVIKSSLQVVHPNKVQLVQRKVKGFKTVYSPATPKALCFSRFFLWESDPGC